MYFPLYLSQPLSFSLITFACICASSLVIPYPHSHNRFLFLTLSPSAFWVQISWPHCIFISNGNILNSMIVVASAMKKTKNTKPWRIHLISTEQWCSVGVILSVRGSVYMFGHTWGHHNCGGLLTSSGWGSGTLLNILQCMGQPPQQRLVRLQTSIVLGLKNSGIDYEVYLSSRDETK